MVFLQGLSQQSNAQHILEELYHTVSKTIINCEFVATTSFTKTMEIAKQGRLD